MDLYEVPSSMYLLGFGMGTMLANFHMCGIVFVKSSFKHTSQRGPMCFMFLMFSFSGPYVLLFVLCWMVEKGMQQQWNNTCHIYINPFVMCRYIHLFY